MKTISTNDLAALLERNDPVILIMAMNRESFARGHIPGSIHADGPQGLKGIDPNADVVVYCTGKPCSASGIAYRQMIAAGYRNVHHYPGGLAEWTACGLPIVTGPDTQTG